MEAILKLLLGYFSFGYIITLIKINYWQYLLKQKPPPPNKFEDLSLKNKILSCAIYPFQTLNWISRGGLIYFPIIPIEFEYGYSLKAKCEVNQAILNNEKYVFKETTHRQFIVEQSRDGVLLGFFHLVGNVFSVLFVLYVIIWTLRKILLFLRLQKIFKYLVNIFKKEIHSHIGID